jgi:transcription-repair coupling factor (superfamily II helicase)
MYMKLLEETVREMKGEELEDDVRATVNLRVDLKLDERYIPDMNQRLMVYRKVAAARTERELESALEEVADRYGPPPPAMLNLAEYGRIRIMADRLGVESIDREGRFVVLKFRPVGRVDPARLIRVITEWPGATLVPPVTLRLDLEATGSPLPPSARRGAHRDQGTSWWTARATAGQVEAGFSKEEILRRPERDPRAENGIFGRLEELFNILSSKELR